MNDRRFIPSSSLRAFIARKGRYQSVRAPSAGRGRAPSAIRKNSSELRRGSRFRRLLPLIASFFLRLERDQESLRAIEVAIDVGKVDRVVGPITFVQVAPLRAARAGGDDVALFVEDDDGD